jgi:hypothetical protein
LLPWRAELTQADELKSYATHSMRETFGQVAESWRVVYVPQPPHLAIPACATDEGLLDALATTCKTTGNRLVGVTPYFASAFDCWRSRFGSDPFWFGVIETDFISLCLVHSGNWIGLKTERTDEDWHKVLPGLMAQIGIASDLGDVKAKMFLAGEGDPPAAMVKFQITWLKTTVRTVPRNPDYRLAIGI